MLGVSNEGLSVIRQFVAEQNVSFPILHDPYSDIKRQYRLRGALSPYPRDYIIDQNGIFRYTSTEYRPDAMIAVIESLLETTNVKNEKRTTTLHSSYPNPFNAETIIEYNLSETGRVRVDIFDSTGKQVRQWNNARQTAGLHRLRWNGRDSSGSPVPSGLYFYRVTTKSFTQTGKMTLLR